MPLSSTPAGGIIEIAAYQDNDSIRMDVKDSGVGIPSDEIDGLFNKRSADYQR